MAIHIIKDVNVYWQTAADAPADAGFLHTISNEATVNLTSDALDVTTMGSDWRDHLAGLKQAVVNIAGFLPSADDYARTVEEMWTGWTENRWIVLEPAEPLGDLPHFAAFTRSVSMDVGMSTGEAETFGAAINARQNFWRAARIHASDSRPSGAQAFVLDDDILGTGATRASELYLIFVLKGANLGAGKALRASWDTTPATPLDGIFRPVARAAFATAINNGGGYSTNTTVIRVDDVGAEDVGINVGDTVTISGNNYTVSAVNRSTDTITLSSGLQANVNDDIAVSRPVVYGNATERMSVRKVTVKASGDMTLSILATALTGNLASANGMNIYAVPV